MTLVYLGSTITVNGFTNRRQVAALDIFVYVQSGSAVA